MGVVPNREPLASWEQKLSEGDSGIAIDASVGKETRYTCKDIGFELYKYGGVC